MSSLSRRFFRLSLINIASSVTVPLVGLVDTAMLGHLPEIRFLAGVALAAILFDYLYWTLGFLRMSTTGLTAQAYGREDDTEVAQVLYRAAVTAAVLGAALLLLQLPVREIGFGLLSGEPGVEQAGREYFDARIWGAPATLCNFVLMGWFLGRAESRHVLVMTVVANLANVLLNYVFIIRLGMAARGAGLASMLSQYLMVAVGAAIYLRCRTMVPWRWADVLDGAKLVSLFRLNRDILLRTLCLVTSFALFVNASSILGTMWLAANSILLRIQIVAAYLVDGVASRRKRWRASTEAVVTGGRCAVCSTSRWARDWGSRSCSWPVCSRPSRRCWACSPRTTTSSRPAPTTHGGWFRCFCSAR